jgi:aryl-alcohol dehydrogenase-like predicted oxidoreductase
MAQQSEGADAQRNRREFLGAGVVTAATALGVTARRGSAEAAPAAVRPGVPFNPRTHQAMPTRNLGKTGHRVGIFSLGCQAAVEQEGKEDVAEAIVNRAIDLGVNYLDTAPAYGRGISETNVGRVVKSRRGEVFLASKTNVRTYSESMALLEQSLKRLNTDHLDLWQLHNVQRKDELETIFGKDGAIQALQKAREQKMVRFLGITGHFEPLVLAEGLERFPFDTILMALNAADVHYLSFIRHLLPLAQKRGVGIIGMKVTTRSRILSSWDPPPLDQQPDARLRTAKPGTLTMREALLYNLSLPVSTTIVGCDNPEQVEQNVKYASEWTAFSDEQMREIEHKTLPIVRQALYFRRWDLGA